MTCYAYYPMKNEEKPEEFSRHSIDIAEYIFKDSAYLTNSVINTISARLGASKDLVHDAILLAGLLHDLGKVDKQYQEMPSHGFSRHEVLSATAIRNIAFKLIKKDGIENLFLDLLTFPILLHHYAQADPYKHAHYIINMKKERIDVYKDCIDQLNEVINYGLTHVQSDLGKKIMHELKNKLSKFEIEIFLDKELKNFLLSNVFYPHKPAIMAIAGLLNEADGTVANKNRNIR
ncbi:CRISPR-associated endonuclease Cas3'' [Vulcanisaeta sp. EB80]|nr:CRISPR-associated endonuclease Cas3'' [Vulcanisaeta sp. EB80]